MTSALKILGYAAVAVGLGAVVTGCTNKSKVRAIEKAYPPIGNFVTVDDAKVHYLQKGEGPDVVLIHGAGGNLRDFTIGMVDLLSDRYRVTVFDRPGHGYTDRAPGVDTGAFATEGDSPMQQANLLKTAAQKVGVTNPVVVGHSFGGIVALAWAVGDLDNATPQAAESVVSLAGVSMPWPDDLGAYYTVNGSALGGGLIVPVLSALANDSIVASSIASVFEPQAPVADYAEETGAKLIIRPDSFRANVRQVNTLRPHVVEMLTRYAELTLPIEMVHGTADTIVPIHVHAQEFIKIAPNANLVTLDGIGHMPQHVAPEVTVEAIDRAASRAGLR